MTRKQISEIIEQFPEEQELFIGVVNSDRPDELILVPIGNIVFTAKHLALLDPDSARIFEAAVSRTRGKNSKKVEPLSPPAL